MNRLTETTVLARKNMLVFGFAAAVLLFIIAGSWYKWTRGGVVTPLEVGSIMLILIVLLERASGRYQIDTDAREIQISKTGMFGRHKVNVSYRQIVGIYEYKAKLVGYIKFRRTHRMHSALDGRDVWVIAYKVQPSGKTEHNERVYFKPSKEMLDFLAVRMPGKVMVPETQVIVDVLKDEKD